MTFGLVKICRGVYPTTLVAAAMLFASGAFAQTAPKITIGAPSSPFVKASSSVSYLITYTGAQAVTLAPSDIILAPSVAVTSGGPTASSIVVTGTGASVRTVVLSGFSGNGTLGISIKSGSASYGTKLAPAVTASVKIAVDTTAPALSIVPPKVGFVRASSTVDYVVAYTGASAVTLSDATKNKVHVTTITGDATASLTITGTGATARTVRLSNFTGNGTLALSVEAGTATDMAGNQAGASIMSVPITVDNSAPAVAVSQPSVSHANAKSKVTYTVTYTGASKILLTPKLVTVTKPSTVTATVAVSGTGTASRTVTVSGFKGQGTAQISLQAGTAVDAAANPAPAVDATGTDFNIDTTAPTISISGPSAPLAKGSSSITYTVTYSGADNVSLQASNISMLKSGTANASLAVSGEGNTTRTITLSSFTGLGTIKLAISPGTASDLANNLAAAALTATPLSVDTVAPVVTIGAPTVKNVKIGGTVSFPVKYVGASEITLAPSDVTVIGPEGGINATVTVAGTGTAARVVTLGAFSAGSGLVSIKIKPGSAKDAAGNLAGESNQSLSITADPDAPTVTVSAPSASVAGPTSSVTYTVTFNGANTVNLTSASIIRNATLSAAADSVVITGTGNTTRTVTISKFKGKGTFGIKVKAGSAKDLVGNLSSQSSDSAPINVVTPLGLSLISGSASLTVTELKLAAPTGTVAAEPGTNLDFTVKTSYPVNVSGTPGFNFQIGSRVRTATYVSGSGSSTILFRYAIAAGDNGAVGWSSGSITGGSITSVETADVALNSAFSAGTTTVTGNGGFLGTVATPSFSPGTGEYGPTQNVTISTSTSNSEIYYTTDGSEPTTLTPPSYKYASPVSVSSSSTLKAIAVRDLYLDSGIATATYTINGPASAPVFTVATGAYGTSQSVTMASLTTGASIYYTTNGTTPTSGSTAYSSAINVAAGTVVKAIAIKSGWSDSSVSTIPTTAIGSPSGTLVIASSSVTLGVTFTGASAHNLTDSGVALVTTGGASATVTVTNGTTATPTVTLSSFTGNGTVAVAIKSNQATSGSNQATGSATSSAITVDTTAPNTPSMTAASGGNANVSWSSGGGNGNSNYRYRIDNSDLSSGTTATTSTSVSTANLSEASHTIYVQERDDAGNWSSSGSLTFIVDRAAPLTPVLSHASGNYTGTISVTISQNATADANFKEFRYNLSSTTPTCSTGTVYSGAISISAATSITAIACDLVGQGSATPTTATYAFGPVILDYTKDANENSSTCAASPGTCVIAPDFQNLNWTNLSETAYGDPYNSACDNLVRNGFDDWRYPTVAELQSAYSAGLRSLNGFNTGPDLFRAAETSNGYYLIMINMASGAYMDWVHPYSYTFHIACVRESIGVNFGTMNLASYSPLQYTVTADWKSLSMLSYLGGVTVKSSGTASASIPGVSVAATSLTVTLANFSGTGFVWVELPAASLSNWQGTNGTAFESASRIPVGILDLTKTDEGNNSTCADTPGNCIYAPSDSNLNWTVVSSGADYYRTYEYCDGLVRGGMDDWRVPTLAELQLAHGSGLGGMPGASARDPWYFSSNWDSAGYALMAINLITGATAGLTYYEWHSLMCVRGTAGISFNSLTQNTVDPGQGSTVVTQYVAFQSILPYTWQGGIAVEATGSASADIIDMQWSGSGLIVYLSNFSGFGTVRLTVPQGALYNAQGSNDTAASANKISVGWHDFTRNSDGSASSCAGNPANCQVAGDQKDWTYAGTATEESAWWVANGLLPQPATLCGNLVRNGYDDWRVPTMDELYNAWYYGMPVYALSANNWFMTTRLANGSSAVNLYTGGQIVDGWHPYTQMHVMCVRTSVGIAMGDFSQKSVNPVTSGTAQITATLTFKTGIAPSYVALDDSLDFLNLYLTGTASAQVVSITGTGYTRTVTLSNFQGSGKINIHIGAGVVSTAIGSNEDFVSSQALYVFTPGGTPSGWADVTTNAYGGPSTCAASPERCSYRDTVNNVDWTQYQGDFYYNGPWWLYPIPATTYCNDLVYNGYDNWFLPDSSFFTAARTKLKTISMPGTDWNYYFWTTSQSSNSGQRDVFRVSDGDINLSYGTTWEQAAVVCVRQN